jgi:hypothetical protein
MRRVLRLPDSIPLALGWRYASHAAMLFLSLLTEARPAPHLPDLVLDRLPRVEWLERTNYWLWLAVYVPVALWLWRRNRSAFVRFLYLGGAVSLARGLCVGLTGLGPAAGPDLHAGAAGLRGLSLVAAWWSLVNPFSALFTDAPHLYLTKDLFFSGHVSSTFLLWLYARKEGRSIAWAAALAHAFTVAVVLLSHLHYTIDVVGAWAITYSFFALAGRGRGLALRERSRR